MNARTGAGPSTHGDRHDACRSVHRRWWLLASALFAASPAVVQGAPETPEAPEAPTISGSYVTDIISNLDGGVRKGVVWLGRADLSVTLPAARLGLPGSFFADVIGIQGGDFSGRYAGDAQIVSNVQAPAAIRLYEMWYQMPISRDVSAKLGLIDLNTEFDVQSVGAGFSNSSFGVGPDFSQSGNGGPSIFPAPGPALLLKAKGGGWSSRLGVFTANPGIDSPRDPLPSLRLAAGVLLVVEADRDLGGERELQVGAWTYSKRHEAIESGERSAHQRGMYVQVEGRLPGTRADDGWQGWLRLGSAAGRVLAINRYAGGGVTWTRGEGRWGLAVAHARLGKSALRLEPGRHKAETAVELHYARRVADWLVVQPDFQYVIHPGWVADRRNAVVAALRLIFRTSDHD
jgi:porin